jgi:RNA polymerase sigma factor (sigma-70 family)
MFDKHFLAKEKTSKIARQNKVVTYFYNKYYRPFTRMAIKLAGHELGPEIVQDSFISLRNQLDTLNTDEIVFEFLIRSVKEGCAKCSEHIQENSLLEIPIPEAEDTCICQDDSQLLLYIRQLVNTLPQQRKKIIINYFWKGFSTAQIAERLKLDRQTVINQKVRALKSMQQPLTTFLINKDYWRS